MIVKIDKSLQKDIKKVNNQSIKNKLAKIIESIQNAKSIKEIPQLKKLKGSKEFYRIRINNYRLGIRIQNEELILVRLLHRKDIYRYFP